MPERRFAASHQTTIYRNTQIGVKEEAKHLTYVGRFSSWGLIGTNLKANVACVRSFPPEAAEQ